MIIVSPSILSANFGKLRQEINDVKNCGAQFIHIDVMDGHFVPNITIGAPVLNSLRDIDIVFDVHLMISDPQKYYKSFIDAGANYLTFHYEAVNNHLELIKMIKDSGVKVGMSIKPNTDVKVLEPFLPFLDLVLVMSVEPGFGGQSFLNSAIDKIKFLSSVKSKNGFNYLIEVDGGIIKETAEKAVEAGCEVLVAGTFIFSAIDKKAVIGELLKL